MTITRKRKQKTNETEDGRRSSVQPPNPSTRTRAPEHPSTSTTSPHPRAPPTHTLPSTPDRTYAHPQRTHIRGAHPRRTSARTHARTRIENPNSAHRTPSSSLPRHTRSGGLWCAPERMQTGDLGVSGQVAGRSSSSSWTDAYAGASSVIIMPPVIRES
ncbi:hypothetical protein DENSPDRAFT_591074 [Dentipellis sp. KUC8613]|nr:hypothetical protein DENSPDRAFT_591074 [Dentipellis sp. KUC8613]